MTRRRTKREAADPANVLGDLLRDAVVRANLTHNRHHTNPEMGEANGTGRAGYAHVARELLAAGVRLPDPADVAAWRGAWEAAVRREREEAARKAAEADDEPPAF